VQIIATRNSGRQTIRYLTTDALGSVDRMIDSAGASLANLSFSAFGSRRGSAWQGGPSSGDQTQIRNATRRGFTWHEHLDNVGLVHMNGRVYDPAIGRFASADPFIAAPYDSQSLNRYSYVGNNPLSFTDPSGFLTAPPNPDNGNPNRPPPDWRGSVWGWFWARVNSRDICGINLCNKDRPPRTEVPRGQPSGDPASVSTDRMTVSEYRQHTERHIAELEALLATDHSMPYVEPYTTLDGVQDLLTVASIVPAGRVARVLSGAARGAASTVSAGRTFVTTRSGTTVTIPEG
jgi:RHS repeat-associated protein